MQIQHHAADARPRGQFDGVSGGRGFQACGEKFPGVVRRDFEGGALSGEESGETLLLFVFWRTGQRLPEDALDP